MSAPWLLLAPFLPARLLRWAVAAIEDACVCWDDEEPGDD